MTDPPAFWDEEPEDERTHLVGIVTPTSAAEAPDERGHYLVVVEGFEPGRRIPIGATPITIGRYPPCDVVLPDSEGSRAHCRVEVLEYDALITDLKSTNGTFVDGKRVEGVASACSRLETGGAGGNSSGLIAISPTCYTPFNTMACSGGESFRP